MSCCTSPRKDCLGPAAPHNAVEHQSLTGRKNMSFVIIRKMKQNRLTKQKKPQHRTPPSPYQTNRPKIKRERRRVFQACVQPWGGMLCGSAAFLRLLPKRVRGFCPGTGCAVWGHLSPYFPALKCLEQSFWQHTAPRLEDTKGNLDPKVSKLLSLG